MNDSCKYSGTGSVSAPFSNWPVLACILLIFLLLNGMLYLQFTR